MPIVSGRRRLGDKCRLGSSGLGPGCIAIGSCAETALIAAAAVGWDARHRPAAVRGRTEVA